MLKGRELIGLPVIDLNTGKEVGLVEDLVVDLEKRKVTGLLVKSGGWITAHRLLTLDKIYRIGNNSIIINNVEQSLNQGQIEERFETGIKSLRGLSILSSTGKELGTVEDLVCDITEGKISGWEISDGLVQDLVDGRKILPQEAVITYGSDWFIVQERGW